ncbi:unnamed protein product, partial [Staurois parvus]
ATLCPVYPVIPGKTGQEVYRKPTCQLGSTRRVEIMVGVSMSPRAILLSRLGAQAGSVIGTGSRQTAQ